MREYQDDSHEASTFKTSSLRDPRAKSSASLSDRQPAEAAAQAVSNRVGDAFATSPRNLRGASPSIAKSSLLRLQAKYGNYHVQRVVGLSEKGDGGGGTASADVEHRIERARGGGQALDSKVQSQMEGAFDADFSGVRVHANSEADSLNRSLNARAFTTGRDVFFRQGEYSPGSATGRELLAHELTHVVQQNADSVKEKRLVQSKLTVGRPGDIYEQEADRMAQAFTRQEQMGMNVGETGRPVRRQEAEEEKKEETPAMTKPKAGTLLRQEEEEPEKEQIATKHADSAIQRQSEQEEEE